MFQVHKRRKGRKRHDGKGEELTCPLVEKSSDEDGKHGREDSKDLKLRVASPGKPLLEVTVRDTDNVLALKEAIESKWADFPKARQRIIYCGRELAVLGVEPSALVTGATIHLALRPEPRIDQLSIMGDAQGHEELGGDNSEDEIPAAVELARQEVIFAQVALDRSSRATRSIGMGFAALGTLLIIRGVTAFSWIIYLAGGGLFLLGTAAMMAGRNNTATSAGLYYYGLWIFMVGISIAQVVEALSFSIPFVLSDDYGNDESSQYMAIMLLL
eukprot:895017-Amorphochlora_amoeboformis.AAC.1